MCILLDFEVFKVLTCSVNQNQWPMKKMIFSLAMVFLAILCFSQEGKNQIKLGLLSGYVENFEYINGLVKEIQFRTYHITEKNGQIIKGKPFTMEDAHNVPQREPWSYFFNEDGQMVQQMLEVDSANTWNAAIHHENGRVEKLYWMIHDTLISYQEVLFPEEGTIEILLRLIEDNTLRNKTVYELDKNGNLIRFTYYGPNGEVNRIQEFERNAEGRTTSKKGFLGDGTLQQHITNYKYNDHGLIESLFLVRLSRGEINKQEGQRHYEYDAQGNWIKLYHEGRMITERKILYYD